MSANSTPSDESLFLYRLHLNDRYRDEANWTEEAMTAVSRHAEFLDELGRQGRLAFAGRTQYGVDHPDLIGISVIRAESLNVAEQLLADDPAIVFGTHTGSVHPFSMAIEHLETFAGRTFNTAQHNDATGSAAVVRRLFERMEARDWDGAGRCLADDVHVEFTATGEQFDGPAFLAMNRAYPEGWTITVVETLADEQRVAAQVVVDHGDDRFRCAGFYTVANGKIINGTEHWVTEGSDEPPDWRAPFRSS